MVLYLVLLQMNVVILFEAFFVLPSSLYRYILATFVVIGNDLFQGEDMVVSYIQINRNRTFKFMQFI